MNLLKFAFSAAVFLSAVAAHADIAHQLTGPGFKSIAYFTQDLTAAGAVATSLTVAPLTVSSLGFGMNKLSTPFSTSGLGAMAPLAVANPTNQGVALANALAWIPANFLAFRPTLMAWMRSQGVSTAVLDYTQAINVTTPLGSVPKAIVFNARVDVDGQLTYGAPKLVDPDPTTTEITYTPLKPKADLPLSWGYAAAGTLQWRVINKRNEALTGWTTIDVGGAYDELPESDAAVVDSDAKLRCLVDARHAGCAGGVPDARSLMNAAGSMYGLVNYVRGVAPEYIANADGSSSAALTVSIDARTFDCRTYTVGGNYGLGRVLSMDRYLATAGSAAINPYVLVQQLSKLVGVTAEPYSISRTVAELGGRDPLDVLLSPVPGSPEWDQSNPDQMKYLTHNTELILTGLCRRVSGGRYVDTPPDDCADWGRCPPPRASCPAQVVGWVIPYERFADIGATISCSSAYIGALQDGEVGTAVNPLWAWWYIPASGSGDSGSGANWNGNTAESGEARFTCQDGVLVQLPGATCVQYSER